MKKQIISKYYMYLLFTAVAFIPNFICLAQEIEKMERPNQHLDDTTFSTEILAQDSNQSIPLGNGDIGVNVWVEENGDLVFYISKSDAWGQNMETLKVGRVRVHIDSQPFIPGQAVQTLKAHEGLFTVTAKKNDGGELNVSLWVDANDPQILLEINSTVKETVTITNELMRPKIRELEVGPSPWTASESNIAYAMLPKEEKTLVLQKDNIIQTKDDHIAWCDYNKESLWDQNVEMNWMGDQKDKIFDPLTHYAFGALISGTGMEKISDTVLTTKKPQKLTRITLTAYRSKVDNIAQWYHEIVSLSKVKRTSYEERLAAHKAWWNHKFENSYISVRGSNEAKYVSLCYNLQRYVSLSAGRGNYPIRFNGSIFTYDHAQTAPLGGKEDFGADYRRWGSLFLVQNNRHSYWPMLVTGDFDTMEPLFDYLQRISPALKLNAINYGVPEEVGALATFEAMTLWGTACTGQITQADTFQELYEKSWALQYHGSALELLLIAVDRYTFDPDKTFLNKFLLPFADGVFKFYDSFFGKENGKMHITGNSLETYSKTVNPTPDLAGLKKNLTALLSIEEVVGDRRTFYTRLLGEIPEIPLRPATRDYGQLNSTIEKYGQWVDLSRTARVSRDDQMLIDVAEEVPNAAWNMENPELYTIFPFRTYHIGKKEEDPVGYDLARRSYLDRVFQQDIGWCQDPIQAAWLGLTHEVKWRLVNRFNAKLPNVLFPVFWKPSFDWSPDQDNGGVALNTLQAMLIQYDGDQIYLCPAWPKDWDVEFKLHGPKKTTVTGSVKDGKLSYTVFPKDRAAAVRSLF